MHATAPRSVSDIPPAGASLPVRDLRQGMVRGARGRCPACGDGAMFASFLKVSPACASCGEDLSAQRADDGPAYLTVLIVSHLVGPLLLVVYMAWQPAPMVMVTGFCAAATLLSLLMLPRIKGGMVGFQWAKRMHGFGDGDPGAPDYDARTFNTRDFDARSPAARPVDAQAATPSPRP